MFLRCGQIDHLFRPATFELADTALAHKPNQVVVPRHVCTPIQS